MAQARAWVRPGHMVSSAADTDSGHGTGRPSVRPKARVGARSPVAEELSRASYPKSSSVPLKSCTQPVTVSRRHLNGKSMQSTQSVARKAVESSETRCAG
jgi:hypothetical protein